MRTGSWLRGLCLLPFLGSLIGCAGSAGNFYVLTPAAPTAGAPSTATDTPRTLGLYPVRLAAYLDRPEIVTRVDTNRLHFAEAHHWGEPLGDGVTRTLGRDLAVLLPGHRVAVFPQVVGGPVGATILVDVAQLDGALGRDCILVARWAVAGKAGVESRAGTFSRSAPAGESYDTFVAAVSWLIGDLAQEIAAGVRGLP